jgi:DNA modification methylase
MGNGILTQIEGSTGQRNDATSVPKNYLFYGDNLDVLRRKIASASVDLCYIDPPFNSKRNYFQIYTNQGVEDRAQAQAFVDTWEWGAEANAGFDWITHIDRLNGDPLSPHAAVLTRQTVALITGLDAVLGRGSLFAYIVHMTQRIVEIHRVLKPTGSFYLHCDPTASHYLKLVCDAVFCGQGGEYAGEIIWRRTNSRSTTGRWPRLHDVILHYARSLKWTFYQQTAFGEMAKTPHTLITGQDGKKYNTFELTGAGLTQEGESGRSWRGFSPASMGRHWGYNHAQLEEWAAGELIHFPKNGGFPRRRAEQPFDALNRLVTVGDVWSDIDRLNQTAKERLGYPTQKPEALLERIIRASSNEGDVVLDAYCGCGTTVAVAQRLGRQWIGIDVTYQSIALILKRLEDRYRADWQAIEARIVLDGIPKDEPSAHALANKKDDKTRKEFEKWAILTYSRNQARINEKKGADGGIDGIAYFLIDKETNGKAIFQVKSGGANRATLATLNSDRQREKAEFGFLISFDPPTKAMRDEISAAGKYKHPLLAREDDRIQVITVAEILRGERLELPMARGDAVKSAIAMGDSDRQENLF